jgi:hypothetical protein
MLQTGVYLVVLRSSSPATLQKNKQPIKLMKSVSQKHIIPSDFPNPNLSVSLYDAAINFVGFMQPVPGEAIDALIILPIRIPVRCIHRPAWTTCLRSGWFERTRLKSYDLWVREQLYIHKNQLVPLDSTLQSLPCRVRHVIANWLIFIVSCPHPPSSMDFLV